MMRPTLVCLALLPLLASAFPVARRSARNAAAVQRRGLLAKVQEDDGFEEQVQEISEKFRRGGLYNEKGVAYAPWMDLDEMAVQKAREMREAKRRAERKRDEGGLYTDAMGSELSGVGLKHKMVGDNVELEWTTGKEDNVKGFVVLKTRGGERKWETVASFKDWEPLKSKGPDGGTYRYQDPTTELGTWYYRVAEEDGKGGRADMCQKLVDVQSESEKIAGKIAVAGFIAVVIAVIGTASVLDPMQ